MGTQGRANPGESVPSWLKQMTDQSLMRRYRSGSADAATVLYKRYAKRLQQLAHHQVSSQLAKRVDPDEIVQSVFRTFFRRAANGQYDFAEHEDLWKLLLVIALNKIRALGHFHRAAKRNVGKTQSLADVRETPEMADDSALGLRVLQMTVAEMVGALPEEQQQIVCLRIEGWEIEEIVQRTGRAKRTIERILQGFRQRLLKVINQDL